MKNVFLGIFFLFSIISYQTWAAGVTDALTESAMPEQYRVHPGARMILEANGYRFNSNGVPISLNNRPINRLSDSSNLNPHSFDSNTIYITNFEVNQWVGNNILATTGSAAWREMMNAFTMDSLDVTGVRGARIYISGIPDKFLKEIGTSAHRDSSDTLFSPSLVRNAFLIYTGVQRFQMANGSEQTFPVFQLIDLFNSTISQAANAFNNAFDAGIYKTEDGYQYSKIGDRTFGRDIATKKELHEWNGNQWIVLIGE